jgi:diguanylate cyclase (GGDEF)-like protein
MLNTLDTAQYQQLLENCPTGMMLIDKDGRAQWINTALRNWLRAKADSVLQQTADTSPSELQALWEENASLHLPASDPQDDIWLLGTSQTLTNGGMIQFFTDASPLKLLMQERDRLQEQLAQLSLTDTETGMPNRRALSQNLESQVSRSRRYQNPLTILIMHIDNLSDFMSQHDTDSAKPLLVAIRNVLNDQLRWADTIGRMDENEFLLILPETHLDATAQMIELLHKRFDELVIEGFENSDFKVEVRFSAAEWHKGDDVGLLMLRAREQLDTDEKQSA